MAIDSVEWGAMVPETGANEGREPTATESIDEELLYVIIREAVEDALLGVIGTLLLVGIGFILIWVGLIALVSPEGADPLRRAIGVTLVAVGFYLAAATLQVIPPVREWF